MAQIQSAAPPPLITVNGLRKQFDSLTAVDGVSFEIRQGEVFGLLGPNGAGKTTTISMLSGTLPPTSGTIDMLNAPEGPTRRRALGIVPQDLAIYLKLTARENLEFFGGLYGLKGEALKSRAATLLEMVGLTERADSRSADFSGGMKRRLNLAIGLMHDPRLLLLDEPTVGVDPQSRNHIFEGVKRLNQQGLTVLYTSHYMEEVEALCHRVGIMDRGRLVACDTVKNLIATLGGSVVQAEIGPLSPNAPEQEAALLSELQQRIATMEHGSDAEIVPAEVRQSGAGSEENPHIVKVRTEAPGKLLPALVSAISATGAPLYNLSLREPNLEDVFLELTGKSLRD
jgi:ABC-2 type transport system ATP-binding protein